MTTKQRTIKGLERQITSCESVCEKWNREINWRLDSINSHGHIWGAAWVKRHRDEVRQIEIRIDEQTQEINDLQEMLNQI